MVNLCVRAFLYAAHDILLFRRINTGFGDGSYSLAGGRVNAGEAALDAIVRKVNEEVGLCLSSADKQAIECIKRDIYYSEHGW